MPAAFITLGLTSTKLMLTLNSPKGRCRPYTHTHSSLPPPAHGGSAAPSPRGCCCLPTGGGYVHPGALSLLCAVSMLLDKGPPQRSSSSSPDAAQGEMMAMGRDAINTIPSHRPQRAMHSPKQHQTFGRSPARHGARWLRNLVQVVFIFNMTVLQR